MASATFVLGVLLYAYGNRLVFGDMNKIVSPSCGSAEVFASVFIDIHRAIIVFVLGNIGGFCFSFVAALSARHQSEAAGAHGVHMREEAKRINLLLAVSAFSVLLATLPQLLFWARDLGLFVFPNGGDYIVGIVFYTSSLINFFLYLMKKECRTRFLWLISAGKFCCSPNEVTVAPSILPTGG
uniref:G-protein coupled receptors family 1 profile domain-containing protein n=1 Tax=Plectus sambesii TaxID=2011161 RepID=A0A914V442_9BILA